jgi:hypothetical protein
VTGSRDSANWSYLQPAAAAERKCLFCCHCARRVSSQRRQQQHAMHAFNSVCCSLYPIMHSLPFTIFPP